MLTAKELSAIEEQLKAEKLLITKNKAYAQLCDDPELRKKCEQMAAKHEDAYQHYYHCWIKGDVYEQKIHERARLI